MKYLLIITCCILFSCSTDEKNKTKKLNYGFVNFKIKSRKYQSNLYNYSLYSKNIKIPIDIVRNKPKGDSLLYGKYQLRYNTIFNEAINIDFELNQRNKTINIIPDSLDFSYIENNKFLMIDNLKNNEKIDLIFYSYGCSNTKTNHAIINKLNNKLYFTFKKNKILINHKNKNLFREFEYELNLLTNNSNCTRTTSYVYVNTESSDFIIHKDKSCNWFGFEKLLVDLGLNKE
ncbi:hypothetical protein [Aurantibacter sp.]|uniref:hypothetical protein n=1 Tax=Aurantibacter sp. TaxID=2807103 RepID=UPI0035C82FE9